MTVNYAENKMSGEHDMLCEPIFDITNQPFTGWPVVFVGVGITLAGLIVSLTVRTWATGVGRWGLALFGALAVSILGGLVAYKYARAQWQMRTGNYQIVEGSIENYQPLPAGAHGTESFRVAARTFEYTEYQLTPGYHQTAGGGGRLKVGDRVKIAFSGNMILRLEICQPR